MDPREVIKRSPGVIMHEKSRDTLGQDQLTKRIDELKRQAERAFFACGVFFACVGLAIYFSTRGNPNDHSLDRQRGEAQLLGSVSLVAALGWGIRGALKYDHASSLDSPDSPGDLAERRKLLGKTAETSAPEHPGRQTSGQAPGEAAAELLRPDDTLPSQTEYPSTPPAGNGADI